MTNKMTITEINRYIHEKILKQCWHDWSKTDTQKHFPFVWCYKCNTTEYAVGTMVVNLKGPDYCSNYSPRQLLSDVVEKVDSKQFGLAMWDILEMTGFYPRGTPNFMACKATAEQIARACVKAHKKGEKINV